MERITQLLEHTPEFQKLPKANQDILLHDNRNRAAALTLAKLESFKEGNEQLRFALGHFDDEVYTQDYASVLSNKKLKRFSLFDEVGACTTEDRNDCLKLVCQINSLVNDMEVYKLLLLHLLFKNEKIQGEPDLDALAFKYEKLLMQRMAVVFANEALGRKTFEAVMSKVQALTDSVFGDTFSH